MFPPSYFPGTSAKAGAVALFAGSDTKTQGNWRSVYGLDGYVVAGRAAVLPAYAKVVTPAVTVVWSTTDTRPVSPVDPGGAAGARIASCWYTAGSRSAGSMVFKVGLSDGLSHRVALYAMDWDSLGRTQSVTITDAATGTVLDTRNLTGFTQGVDLVWYVKGDVNISVANTPPSLNAVVSGLFLG